MYLNKKADREGIKIYQKNASVAFADLIQGLRNKYSKNVVVLIDEYDSPIISNLDDIEKAKQIRDKVRDFYKQLKSNEGDIKFLLLTGVSKFSKAGVFSALNNLEDLTFHPMGATICGITQTELENYFNEEIGQIAKENNWGREEALSEIRRWYNGYCFDIKIGPAEQNKVYNPFSTLNLFKQRVFTNHWHETGSPKFLIDLLKQNRYPIETIENKEVELIMVSSYEPEDLNLLALLLQTGYLTIKEIIDVDVVKLDYPNYEVEKAFLGEIAKSYLYESKRLGVEGVHKAERYLIEGDIEAFMEWVKVQYADIPYDMVDKLKNKEQFYQTAAYLVLKMLGLKVNGEVRTNKGRIDLLAEIGDKVYIIEMKINSSGADAIEQIKEKGYAQKYQGKGKEIYLLGIGLDVEERNVSDYMVERQ